MILEINKLDTGYAKKQVLFNVSLEVPQEKITAIIGPNGSGKSTVLNTIFGILPVWAGQIQFTGASLNDSDPTENVFKGITFAPQGNRVFDELTILENLEMGGHFLGKQLLKDRIEEMLAFFPILRERLKQEAGKLSGGEQQQLSLARALIPQPKLLMLDEPSLGLAPSLIKSVFVKITEINRKDKTTILIVEQKVREVLDICHKVYSLKMGKVAFEGKPDELKGDLNKLRELFL
jgi:branched-chain amino acid transport system ATP-binding protein